LVINMERPRTEKLDVLDLIINVLKDQSDNLSDLEDRLETAIQRLTETIEIQNKRNEVMLKYYEAIGK